MTLNHNAWGVQGISPKTAELLGCIEHRELWGTSPLGRALLSASMPDGVIMVQSNDGALWSWPIDRQLLREMCR